MQAKELERNQDPPSPAQNIRRQRIYFVNRANTRMTYGLYDLGCWNGAPDKQNNNLIKADIAQKGRESLVPALAPQRILSRSIHQNPPDTGKYPDHLLFQREVYLFLFSQRTILSIHWEKMATNVGLYLNDREMETISYLAAGYGAKEIAREFNLSPRTVEHRIETLKRRLGARNVTHLIAMVLLAKPARNAGISESRSK